MKPARRRAAPVVRVLAAWILAACGAARADAPPDAARALFPPGAGFAPVPLAALSDDEIDAVEDLADVRVRPKRIRIWRTPSDGGADHWLFIDQVIGKHEFITYALAVGADGAVTGFDILEYLESYGGEVQRPSWRAQFYGRSLANSALRLGRDIDNISGATLSSRNLTDGIRKLLLLREALARAAL